MAISDLTSGVHANAAEETHDYEISLIDVAEQPAAIVHGRVQATAVSEFVGDAFRTCAAAAAEQGAVIVGPPFARYAVAGSSFEIDAGFPTARLITAAGGAVPIVLPAGTVAQTVHVGSYAEVWRAYAAITAWESDHEYVSAGAPWEIYLDDPDVDEPRTLVTAPCRPADTHPSAVAPG